MQAIVLKGKGDIVVEERAIPQLEKPTDVIVHASRIYAVQESKG